MVCRTANLRKDLEVCRQWVVNREGHQMSKPVAARRLPLRARSQVSGRPSWKHPQCKPPVAWAGSGRNRAMPSRDLRGPRVRLCCMQSANTWKIDHRMTHVPRSYCCLWVGSPLPRHIKSDFGDCRIPTPRDAPQIQGGPSKRSDSHRHMRRCSRLEPPTLSLPQLYW